jgi:hypothetical protein
MKKTLFIAAILAISAFSVNAKSSQFYQIVTLGDTTLLKQYAGNYKLAEGSPIESLKFFVKDGELMIDAGSYGISKLTNVDTDTFEDPQYKGIITFTRTDGVVTGFKQKVMGMEMVATKEIEKK